MSNPLCQIVCSIGKDQYYDDIKSGDIGNVVCSLDWDQNHHRLIFHEVTDIICKIKGCAEINHPDRQISFMIMCLSLTSSTIYKTQLMFT